MTLSKCFCLLSHTILAVVSLRLTWMSCLIRSCVEEQFVPLKASKGDWNCVIEGKESIIRLWNIEDIKRNNHAMCKQKRKKKTRESSRGSIYNYACLLIRCIPLLLFHHPANHFPMGCDSSWKPISFLLIPFSLRHLVVVRRIICWLCLWESYW